MEGCRREAGEKRRNRGILEKDWRELGMEGCRMVAGESKGWRVIGGWLERVWA